MEAGAETELGMNRLFGQYCLCGSERKQKQTEPLGSGADLTPVTEMDVGSEQNQARWTSSHSADPTNGKL